MTLPEFPEEDANVVIAPNGDDMHCGEICAAGAAAAGVQAGPIRLLQGRQGQGGFGLAHMYERDRPKAIEGRGFKAPKDYAFVVARGWTHIYRGGGDRITIAIECAGGMNALVLHWQGAFWSIVTALPFRRPKEPLKFQKERPDESEPRPTLAARPRFETLTLPGPKGP